jgi:arylamine N-acetyltransferase
MRLLRFAGLADYKVRLKLPPLFTGFGLPMDHMLNIVEVGGADYLVDVGFSKHAYTSPLPLAGVGTVHATRHGEYRCEHSLINYVDTKAKFRRT